MLKFLLLASAFLGYVKKGTFKYLGQFFKVLIYFIILFGKITLTFYKDYNPKLKSTKL